MHKSVNRIPFLCVLLQILLIIHVHVYHVCIMKFMYIIHELTRRKKCSLSSFQIFVKINIIFFNITI